jgi:hypothetical protein
MKIIDLACKNFGNSDMKSANGAWHFW